MSKTKSKLKIHKGDQVTVVTGKASGKSGKVLRVDVEKHRVYVEHVNMMKKATRPDPKKNPQGGVIEREAGINISNVMLVCPACGRPTRVGFRVTEQGDKVRMCRRQACMSDIGKA
jgi:large subunit ribosomal protein L24